MAPPLTKSVETSLTGETFGDFRLMRKLGQGGMGQVYLAEQLSLKRKVAIKMLREDVAANPTALARFQSESKTIAQLSHANVVQAYTVGEHEGRHYLALEYVQGVSLREYIEKKGPLEVPLVLSLMRQVASALHRASELDIVHRDIKPENILLTRKGEAKVADFGLSLCLSMDDRVDLTRAGSTVGTPLYMSPEQIEGKEIDCRSDIYSFGVTCYHMLAGKPPFQGSTAFAVAAKHMREEPADLATLRDDLPPDLCKIIRKMMAKKPGDRYASARDLLQAISRLRQSLGNATTTLAVGADTPADDVPTPTDVEVEVDEPAMPAWKKPIVLAAAGVAALVLFAIIGVLAVTFLGAAFFWTNRGPTENEIRAALPAPVEKKPVEPRPDAIETLKQTVEQHLKEFPGKPGGVDACIDLGVYYLEKNQTREAESLFKRMAERKPPSSYYFVGRLGLAVTDSLHNDPKASRTKFMELFDSKTKDNRVQILNDQLTKNPDFASWVNEADTHNVRNGVAERSLPKGFHRPVMTKFPFKK